MSNPVLSEFAMQFVLASIPVLITGIAYLGKQVISYIKTRTSAEQYALLEAAARQAVQAVEQTLHSKAGAEKQRAAVAIVNSALLSRGIALDETRIVAAVEAAVYENLGVKFEIK